MQTIALIAAMSENRVIGRDNRLPWKMPADHDHFYTITDAHPFIMGRKSYLSRDRFLSTKRSVILTHHFTDFLHPNCVRAESLGEALSMLIHNEKIFILGGGEVFRQSLAIANYIYLTVIHAELEGDTFFPELDRKQWELVKNVRHRRDPENPYDYSFREYRRI